MILIGINDKPDTGYIYPEVLFVDDSEAITLFTYVVKVVPKYTHMIPVKIHGTTLKGAKKLLEEEVKLIDKYANVDKLAKLTDEYGRSIIKTIERSDNEQN